MPRTAVNDGEAVRATKESRNRSNPSRHSLKCAICNHPDRLAIEFDFLNWRNPGDLVKSYRFRSLSTIYRHAHATGLFAKRRLNLRFAMERIVERVSEVLVTATSVIRAARAVARINDSGQWVDPPSRLIVEHVNSEEVGNPAFVGADPRRANGNGGTGRRPDVAGSQPVHFSVEENSGDRRARAGTSFVGRGGTCPERSRGNRDIKRRSSKSSIRARQAGEGTVPSIAAHDASRTKCRPSLIFDDALLDEPSDSASGELPRINGKPPEPEVILTITPEFARCREERRRAIEADRQASAASGSRSGGFTPPVSRSSGEAEGAAPAILGLCKGTASAVPWPTPQKEQSVASPPSLLPQAAFPNSAPSALPHPAAPENNVADNKENVASPSSAQPEAAPDKPATACPEQGRGATQPPPAFRHAGSSGSCDPPFPFTPEPLRRWKPRRRF